MAPLRDTRRAATRRSSSQPGASRPSTTAAVLAVFAATQDGPVAVTVRQTSAAGPPVRGSRTW